jgi:hypothetical protein
MPKSAINACMKVQLNISSAPGKSVAVPPPPGCRNSGKSEGEIVFQNEIRASETHEKISGKCEAGMSRIYFQRKGTQARRSEAIRDYSPTKQQLQAHYSLTVRRHRLIK